MARIRGTHRTKVDSKGFAAPFRRSTQYKYCGHEFQLSWSCSDRQSDIYSQSHSHSEAKQAIQAHPEELQCMGFACDFKLIMHTFSHCHWKWCMC